MKAVVRRGSKLEVDKNFELPQPGTGQVIVKTLCCGICGSDLHALHHMDHFVSVGQRSGAFRNLEASHDLVFGHEFCAEIVDYGPGCRKTLKPGQNVVSIPYAAGPSGLEVVGYSNTFPGGFAEYMVLQEDLLLPVPGGVDPEAAGLTEPLAVGRHTVNMARLTKNDVAMVIGCGPVGLAVIAALKQDGFGPVVASDFSAERRAAAEMLGADIVIDPARTSPHASWQSLGVAATLAEVEAMTLQGKTGKDAVVFECVGVPGLIQSLIMDAPPATRVIVAGVCMSEDTFEPAIAINKQMSLQFVLGYNAAEFASCLTSIAEGQLDTGLFLSGSVGMDEVSATFGRLENEPSSIKIMVKPHR